MVMMLDSSDITKDFPWRWLIFDAVGTLIHPDPPVAVAYHSVATRHGSRLTVAEIGERFKRAFKRSETEPFTNGPSPGFPLLSSEAIEAARWRWIVGEVIPDVDSIEDCYRELWDHFARPTSWSCFDDVEETLSTLSMAGIRLAIASNFDSRLHEVWAGHAPLKSIEHRFVSSECGCRKPARDFYDLILSHCDCPPNQILMVGDDPEHDVAGPMAAGMQSLLIDRRPHSASGSIQSLLQLVKGTAITCASY